MDCHTPEEKLAAGLSARPAVVSCTTGSRTQHFPRPFIHKQEYSVDSTSTWKLHSRWNTNLILKNLASNNVADISFTFSSSLAWFKAASMGPLPPITMMPQRPMLVEVSTKSLNLVFLENKCSPIMGHILDEKEDRAMATHGLRHKWCS
ncbi:hypothetical protein AB1N83_011299 [Pleurotus pulmonarius]